MPVADFPGQFGWGYDGVDLFAPTRLYGTPDDFRRFVDRGTSPRPGRDPRRGLQPLRPRRQLPAASSPTTTSPTATRTNGARRSISTATDSRPVREFFLANAGYWIDEFHLDGLRLDATQSIHDASPSTSSPRSPARLAQAAGADRRVARGRERAAGRPAGAAAGRRAATASSALERRLPPRRVVRAHRPQRGLLLRLSRHAAGVHLGASKHGFLYQGQRYALAEEARAARRRSDLPRRGLRALPAEPRSGGQLGRRPRLHQLDQPRPLAGHDGAAGCSRRRRRCSFRGRSSPPRAVSVLRRSRAELAAAGAPRGGSKFLSQFPSLATPEMRRRIPDPARPRRRSSAASSISPSASDTQAITRCTATCCGCGAKIRCSRHSAATGSTAPCSARDALIVRYFGDDERRSPAARQFRPRFAISPPSPSRCWRRRDGPRGQLLWSSEDPRYGGRGTAAAGTRRADWRIPGEAAVVLKRAAQAWKSVCLERTRMSLMTTSCPMRSPWPDAETAEPQPLLTREWLVTNGLGGYASGTVSGAARGATTACSSPRCPRRWAG